MSTVVRGVLVVCSGAIRRARGGVPVPQTTSELPQFFSELELLLAKGRIVYFFPEGELVPYDTSLRDFKRGAFHLAAQARVPVVPLSIRFAPPKGVGDCFAANPRWSSTSASPSSRR